MHKDANLRKRNALVIPGGLLALYGLVGMVYAALLRGDQGACGDGSLIVFAGACRSAVLVLAIPVVIGLAMVGVGALAFRSQATCRHGHGSWTHFGLAALISMALMPLLAMFLAPSLLGPDAAIERNAVRYPLDTIFAGLAGLGFLMLIPYVALYAGQVRANPCCQERGCFEPCFCDEAAAPAEAPAPSVDEAYVAPAAPLPEPEPAPAPEAQWETVPEAAPAEEWQTVPDEPVPEPVPPASEPTPEEPQAATSQERPQLATPALATRPTDPAAPPSDAMAVAAKWAEEDEEALRELDAQPKKSPKKRHVKAAAKKAPAKAAKGAARGPKNRPPAPKGKKK